MKTRDLRNYIPLRWAALTLALLGLFAAGVSNAQPPWIALANQPTIGKNAVGIGTMLLLSDGTVMAQQAGFGRTNFTANWFRLTPDLHGSYANGSWTNRRPMNFTRQYYSSVVLHDGRVLVAGAEYGNGWNTAEVYDPVIDAWTIIQVPPNLVTQNNTVNPTNAVNSAGFMDSGSVVLPDGTVLISPVNPGTAGGTVIFDPVSNTFSAGAILVNANSNTDEQSWVKLPDDSVLTFDSSQTSQRYIPSLKQWIPDANLPVQLYDAFGGEMGAGLLLPNANAFFLGANGNTVLYTPSGSTNIGHWTIGPVIPAGQGAPDAAAAMMVNGRILCAVSPVPTAKTNVFPTPTTFYEYDYSIGTTGKFNLVDSPRGSFTNAGPAYNTRMLALPDGNILFSDGGSQLYLYPPSSGPLPAGKPHLASIIPLGNGSYQLTGTLLNGLSVGAAYGDDAQMDSNFPLVRVKDGNGNVYYLPTFNWSSTGVQTGNRLVSTEFFAFQRLEPGLPYSLEVVANGIGSDPVTFYGPVWVDLSSGNPTQTGSFDFPYHTLPQGIGAVPNTGTINFKTAGFIPALPPLTKPLSLVATGGPVKIGQ